MLKYVPESRSKLLKETAAAVNIQHRADMLLKDLPFQSLFSIEIQLEVKIEIYVPKSC